MPAGVIKEFVDRFAKARTTGLVLSSAVGPMNIGASAQSAAESDLCNRVGKPILVDAVKIQCGLLDGTGGTVLAHLQAGSAPLAGTTSLPDDAFILTESPLRALQCRFTIGGVQLTRDYIPLYGLSGGWDLRSSALCVVWAPPAPIYLETGEFLRPELRYPAYTAPAILGAGGPIPNSAVTAQVTFACRVLEDPQDWLGPDDLRVLPYVSNYQPAPIAALQTAVQNLQSSDSDLINQSDTDLYVHAFMGNCITQIFDTLIGDLDQTLQGAVGATPGPLANYPERGIKVRMETSEGLSIVKDAVPFSHLFSAVDSVWWVNTKLSPRQFFRVYLDVDFTDGTAFMNDTGVVTPTVTMHGSFFAPIGGAASNVHRRGRDFEMARAAQAFANSGRRPGGGRAF